MLHEKQHSPFCQIQTAHLFAERAYRLLERQVKHVLLIRHVIGGHELSEAERIVRLDSALLVDRAVVVVGSMRCNT